MFKKKKEDTIIIAVNTDDFVICPECGGSGEVVNDNHYLADTSWEDRYITCNRCFGIGYIRKTDEK